MKKAIIEWMEEIPSEEIKYRMDHFLDFDYSEQPTEDKVTRDIYNDPHYFEDSWQNLIECLTDFIQEKNSSGKWKAEVKNFGWRKQNGFREFYADNGQAFLNEILPKTECHFRIFPYGKKGLKIQNFHHDSPTGDEMYFIRKCA